MNIYTIGDLHLSLASNKPMEIFGSHWAGHAEKIAAAWREVVQSEDVVVVPGDISWAIDFDEVLPDLQFLQELPGRKILLKGNHEHWWSTGKKLENLKTAHHLTSISFLHNAYIYIEEKGVCICGTRGWKCPERGNAEGLSEQDMKIYRRELLRLERSLEGAAACGSEILAFIHYPPFNYHHDPNEFTELLEKYRVKHCYYGHLHGPSHRWALNGKLADSSLTDYRLVSADYLDFKPILIL